MKQKYFSDILIYCGVWNNKTRSIVPTNQIPLNIIEMRLLLSTENMFRFA